MMMLCVQYYLYDCTRCTLLYSIIVPGTGTAVPYGTVTVGKGSSVRHQSKWHDEGDTIETRLR